MVTVSQEHIEIVEGAGGPKTRIAGHRIRVQDVAIWHETMGMSVDEILEQVPTITRADVHAALAYYWDHRDKIDAEIAADEAFVAEFRKQYPEGPLEKKLKQLRGE
ncbi:MAG: DUF433 domain-containing protein [Thermomicrobiales bacterium]